jgi:hypothetical protein
LHFRFVYTTTMKARNTVALVCAIFLHELLPACAQQAATPQQSVTPPKQPQRAEAPSAAVQGRQHPSYQVFAHDLVLTAINAPNKTTLQIGEKLKVDVGRLRQTTSDEKKAVAAAFDVSLDLVTRVFERSASNTTLEAEQFAKDLRTTVTDYKYLLKSWGDYHPPASAEKPKQEGAKGPATR